jgi:hypothetical protein
MVGLTQHDQDRTRKACQYELKTESTKERSPTELRCASLPTSPPEGYADGKQLIRKAATSALTFMTFS